ncbi:FHA domain-containing protein [Akkermansiaceae bacterium]|nr:FHA domain-containing protein [Akkermansiaceae bacterium]
MPRILISEEDKKPQPYKIKLSTKRIKIGRADDNMIKLTDVNTSSNHCTIVRVKGGFLVEDNNSTNGVLLEGDKYKYIDLVQDTEFFLGDVKVNFTFNEDEYDILADEEFSYMQIKLDDYNDTEAEEIELEDDDDDEEEEVDLDDEEDEDEDPSVLRRNTGGKPAPLLAKTKKVKTATPAKKAKAAANPVLATASTARVSTTSAPFNKPVLASQKKSSPALFILLCAIAIVGGFCLKHYQVAEKNFLLNNLFGEKIYVEKVIAPAVNDTATEQAE